MDDFILVIKAPDAPLKKGGAYRTYQDAYNRYIELRQRHPFWEFYIYNEWTGEKYYLN